MDTMTGTELIPLVMAAAVHKFCQMVTVTAPGPTPPAMAVVVQRVIHPAMAAVVRKFCQMVTVTVPGHQTDTMTGIGPIPLAVAAVAR